MPLGLRCLVSVAGFALLAAGCAGESNNRGKIEGKWKMISGPPAADLRHLEAVGATPYMEFRPDGTVIADTDFKQAPRPPGRPPFELPPLPPSLPPPRRDTYELLSGDGVRLGHAGRASVVIDGDSMTMTTAEGVKLYLARWK